jgi:hypothetical protein
VRWLVAIPGASITSTASSESRLINTSVTLSLRCQR